MKIDKQYNTLDKPAPTGKVLLESVKGVVLFGVGGVNSHVFCQ